jgi:excisionase family DNA binding protein
MASEAPYLTQLIEKKDEQIIKLVRENEQLKAQLGSGINQDDELISASEAAALLRMNAQSIRQLARDGEIPSARKVGGAWRFSKVALMGWRR